LKSRSLVRLSWWPETPPPAPDTLNLMREVVAPQLAEVYPQFAAKVWGLGKVAVPPPERGRVRVGSSAV